ncbi:cytochrome P450 2U1 [Strongylocentrotus purpuratus]|uniref:Cytochrome P450 n=1 Tax=Strongylocentrotus purpuratus TaxID=7668 RepID=A0A7M7TGG9_STRPU|nr:cytochrome P450 2U1 [Strongylocentrotus purpuratus]
MDSVPLDRLGTLLIVTLLCMVGLRFLISWIRDGKKIKLPPGPTAWPLVGSIPFLIRSKLPPLDLLTALADDHGDILRLRIMTTEVVILSSYDIIKEAYNHPNLQGRPRIVPIEDYIGRRNIGVAGSSGPVWREHRQFVFSAFRHFSTGPQNIDHIIHVEARTLVSEVSTLSRKPFNPHKVLNNAVSNVIAVMLFGKAYNYADDDFNQLQEIINTNLQEAASGGIYLFIPFLAKVPFSPANKIKQGIKRFTDFTKKIVNEHRHVFEPDHPRDIIDLYLKKIQEDHEGGIESSFDETNLHVLCGDLFGASTETTNASLKWSILYMMIHPEVQTKVQEELDRVVGRDRLPELDDRASLPFTLATLHEIQRMGHVFPLSIPHACTADMRLADYDIPEGTLVVSNLWRLSRDSRLWSDPDEFRPDRFLNESGDCIKPEALIPFSIGKRVCIGESIARKEIFVFFSSLLHRFHFSIPAGGRPPSLQGRLGLVYDTQDYITCASPRT